MARLIVFRGETAAQEVVLDRLPLTIGRGPGNDLVLEDPVKSVSREHAEIRLEGGRFVLADRQSENGIWVAGHRLAVIPFELDTIASIGPFRLKVEGPPPPVAAEAEPEPEPAPAPVPAPVAPRQTPAAARAAAGRPMVPVTASVTAFLGRLSPNQKMAAAAALVLVSVGVVATTVVIRSARERDRAAAELAATVAAASTQLAAGACADALAVIITPALMRDPGNADLLALKQRADACLAQPDQPEPPPPSPTAMALAAARDAMLQGQCDAPLLQQVVDVLAAEPENAEALALKAEVEKCASKPARPVVSTPKAPLLAQRIQPEDGGLEPLPGELDRDYQVRVRVMRQRYEDAVTAASRSVGRSIIEALEAIARDASPQYLSIAANLDAARRAYAESAQRVLAEARELAKNRHWNEALKKYDEAKAIDPAAPVDAEIRKVREDKKQEGETICRAAKPRLSFDLEGAIKQYQQLLDLFEPEGECLALAQKYATPK